MPYDMMFINLAHEYGHAWENQNKKLSIINHPQNLVFTEGFAEWVSYYSERIKEEAEEMRKRAKENCDPVYSTELKKMMKLEKKLGSKKAVLEYVKNNTNF